VESGGAQPVSSVFRGDGIVNGAGQRTAERSRRRRSDVRRALRIDRRAGPLNSSNRWQQLSPPGIIDRDQPPPIRLASEDVR
jgi:hypothetical protein